MKAKETNTFGIRYLSKGRPGKGRYSVKIEIGCSNGRHGKQEYFYEGNDYELAKAIALKVQSLMRQGGVVKALSWKDYDMEGWLQIYGSKDETYKGKTSGMQLMQKQRW